ncbi:hypothetical protein OC846_006676, partial [Tilletia horrida]
RDTPVFSSTAFQNYEMQLLEHLKAPETSIADQIKAALPLIAEQMQAYSSATLAHFDQRTSLIQSEIQAAIRLSAQQAQEQRIRHEQQVRGLQTAIVSLMSNGTYGSSTQPHTNLGNNEVVGSLQPSNGFASSLPPPPPPFAAERPVVELEATVLSASVASAQGLRGLPSVEKMDEDWGSEWRRSDKDRKHYERRLRIIRHIENLAVDKGVSLPLAVMMLEHARLQQSNKSLAKLSDLVRDDSQLQYPSLDLIDLDTVTAV